MLTLFGHTSRTDVDGNGRHFERLAQRKLVSPTSSEKVCFAPNSLTQLPFFLSTAEMMAGLFDGDQDLAARWHALSISYRSAFVVDQNLQSNRRKKASFSQGLRGVGFRRTLCLLQCVLSLVVRLCWGIAQVFGHERACGCGAFACPGTTPNDAGPCCLGAGRLFSHGMIVTRANSKNCMHRCFSI